VILPYPIKHYKRFSLLCFVYDLDILVRTERYYMKPLVSIMKIAIQEARKAENYGDYPVGAVVARGSTIISAVGNRSKRYDDPTLHAEILAIQSAARSIGRDNVEDCILYSTHEPCIMCTGAIIYARMKGLVFGVTHNDIKTFKNKHNHFNRSWRTVDISTKLIIERSEHKIDFIEKFMEKECNTLLHL